MTAERKMAGACAAGMLLLAGLALAVIGCMYSTNAGAEPVLKQTGDFIIQDGPKVLAEWRGDYPKGGGCFVLTPHAKEVMTAADPKICTLLRDHVSETMIWNGGGKMILTPNINTVPNAIVPNAFTVPN